MVKQSSKFQLLKQENDNLIAMLKERREMIEQLRKEKELAYHNGYKQGRFDEKMKWKFQEHD